MQILKTFDLFLVSGRWWCNHRGGACGPIGATLCLAYHRLCSHRAI